MKFWITMKIKSLYFGQIRVSVNVRYYLTVDQLRPGYASKLSWKFSSHVLNIVFWVRVLVIHLVVFSSETIFIEVFGVSNSTFKAAQWASRLLSC